MSELHTVISDMEVSTVIFISCQGQIFISLFLASSFLRSLPWVLQVVTTEYDRKHAFEVGASASNVKVDHVA